MHEARRVYHGKPRRQTPAHRNGIVERKRGPFSQDVREVATVHPTRPAQRGGHDSRAHVRRSTTVHRNEAVGAKVGDESWQPSRRRWRTSDRKRSWHGLGPTWIYDGWST